MTNTEWIKTKLSKPFLMKLVIFIFIIFLGTLGWLFWGNYIYEQEAPLRAGVSALKGDNYQLALKNIIPFAEKGNPLAQKLLGDMYAFGWGVPVDEVKAEIWYRHSENNCFSKNTKNRCVIGEIEYGVSKCYLTGCYGKKDALIAQRWMIRSAEAGNIEAQQFLADPSKQAKYNLKIDPKILAYWKNYLE